MAQEKSRSVSPALIVVGLIAVAALAVAAWSLGFRQGNAGPEDEAAVRRRVDMEMKVVGERFNKTASDIRLTEEAKSRDKEKQAIEAEMFKKHMAATAPSR